MFQTKNRASQGAASLKQKVRTNDNKQGKWAL